MNLNGAEQVRSFSHLLATSLRTCLPQFTSLDSGCPPPHGKASIMNQHDMDDNETHDTPICPEHGLALPDKEWNEDKEEWVCPKCEGE